MPGTPSNDFYTRSADFVRLTRASGPEVRAEFDNVQVAFDDVETEANKKIEAPDAASGWSFPTATGNGGKFLTIPSSGKVISAVAVSSLGDGLVLDEDDFASDSEDDAPSQQSAKVFTVNKDDFAAKGDLIAGTGASAYGTVSVGADGQVLKAASGETEGVEWADETIPGVSASVSNLVVTRPTVSTVRIRCQDAILRDENGATFRTGPVDVTVDITAAGANGLDEGAEGVQSYSLFLIYNGTAVAGIMAIMERVVGTTDGTTADKLVDSTETFQTDNVQVGAWVTNTTDNTRTRVSAVDSETQLSLEDDIFESGENYELSNEKPELPSGYTFWTPPISFIRNDTDIIDFVQYGNLYHYRARNLIASNLSSTSYAAQDISVPVPTQSGRVQDVLFGGITDAGGDAEVHLSDDGVNAKTVFGADNGNNGVGDENELYQFASAAPVFVPVDVDDIHYKVNANDVDLYVRAFHLSIPVN